MDENTSAVSVENQLPPFLNAEHISGYLGISRASAYNLFHSSGFPTLFIGRRMIVPRDHFLSWIEHQLENKLQEDLEDCQYYHYQKK